MRALMQDANQGFAHNVWLAAQQKGDEVDADFVKVSVLGQTMVVAVSPEAANCIVKRQKWVPKDPATYSLFRWAVRTCHNMRHRYSAGAPLSCSIILRSRWSLCPQIAMMDRQRSSQVIAGHDGMRGMSREPKASRHNTTSCSDCLPES